jgi:hypothetical protein
MHTFGDLFNNHFLTWYKPLSILFTGAFGILGLVKNFKEKTFDRATGFEVERITKWGRVSLIGIVLSSSLGIAAQVVENNKIKLEAAEARKLQAPLEDPKLDIDFWISCDGDVWYRDICAHQWAPQSHFGEILDSSDFGELHITLELFRDAKYAQDCLGRPCLGDLYLEFSLSSKAHAASRGGAENHWLRVTASDMPLFRRRMPSDGIKSATEIRDAVTVVIVSGEKKSLGRLNLHSVSLILKDGSWFRGNGAVGSSLSGGTTWNEVHLDEN